MSFWKKLFCNHVWMDTGRDFLREDRDVYIEGDFSRATIYKDFIYYAITTECVKCRKIKIYEKRYLKN